MSPETKDFSSVSPSAKSLLMMKGYTNTRQTAAMMQGAEAFGLSFDDKDFWFWMRVMHFESRYWSIDQLLRQTDGANILELSSGYSLRGLDLCARDSRVHYIDTDLPEVVAQKEHMVASLQEAKDLKGRFELLPLNAMDEAAFAEVVSRFGGTPLTIVNEGLLMYLAEEEKVRLCATIHKALKASGGCWITADIYVRRGAEIVAQIPQSESEAAFFQQHKIEENKFESYEAAQTFFKAQGFELVQEAVPNDAALSTLPQLLKALPKDAQTGRGLPKIQATWMLQAV